MRFILSILLMVLFPILVQADAVIFSGNDVKALKPNLDLNGIVKVMSGAVDPTSVATTAPKGTIYLNTSTGITYQKQDAGSTTNWFKHAKNPMNNGGDTIYGGAAGTETRLANGLVTQQFKSGGTTAAPTWGWNNVASVVGNTTTTNTNELILVDASSSGNMTVTLHTAVGNSGKSITIKKTDATAFAVNIGVTSSQTIDNSLYNRAMTLAGQFITFTSDGANWQITKFNTAGEYVFLVANGAPPTTATWGDLTNLTLGTGKWSITVLGNFIKGSGTTLSSFNVGIGTASGTSTAGLNLGETYAAGGVDNTVISIPAVVFYPTTSTSYYLKINAAYTLTNSLVYGRISAQRVGF